MPQKFNFTAIVTISLLTVLLASCGWHLRGSGQSLADIGSVTIRTHNTNNGLYSALNRSLEAQKAHLVDSLNADYVIEIINQQTERRTAAVSGSARVAEFQLISTVTYLIHRNTAVENQQILLPQKISVERFFDFEEDRVLANQTERQQLQESIDHNLANKIIRHLQVLAFKPAD